MIPANVLHCNTQSSERTLLPVTYTLYITLSKREIIETEIAIRGLDTLTDLDREYLAGTHDRALCLLEELGIEHDFQFCHKDEYD